MPTMHIERDAVADRLGVPGEIYAVTLSSDDDDHEYVGFKFREPEPEKPEE